MFKDVGPMLLEIYKVSFPHEIKGNYQKEVNDHWKQSEKSLFEFLRQYEICPQLLNKSTVYQLFIQSKEDIQAVYTPSGKHILKQTLLQTGSRTREQPSGHQPN